MSVSTVNASIQIGSQYQTKNLFIGVVIM